MFISVLLISVFVNSVKTIYLIYDTDRLKQCIALIVDSSNQLLINK